MLDKLRRPSKADEVAAESSSSTTQDTEAPPTYAPDEAPPPDYAAISTALNSLSVGPPDETISVPMVHRRDPTSIHRLNPFSRKGYESTPSYITARKMKRSQYLAHYAKDAEGNFVGTAAPAPDAGLVFVLGKSTDADLLKQVEEVALGVQRNRGNGIGGWGKPLKDDRGDGLQNFTGASF